MNNSSLLPLVRLGIGHRAEVLLLTVDWNELKDLAVKQGLGAIVLDGIERLPERQRPPKVFLLEWIGETLQRYEYRYVQYRKAIAELAGFYNSYGLKMMVLKGYACSIDWPKPEHRPCGDIDIWLFGKQKEADKILEAEKPVQGVQEFKVDKSHHHHTVFFWRDFMVENHYDFVNVHAHRSSAEMEKIFRELGSEAYLNENDNHNPVGTRIQSVEVYGEKVYLPSANLHALFLIKHMVSHFASSEISLRQVLDWAFFVDKHTNVIDWKWLNEMVDKFHMKEFVNCINAICVEDLGFEASIFHGVQYNPQLKDRVLSDILFPEYGTAEPKGLISKCAYKYRRWKGNAWKHDMCYGEGRWESFWWLLRSHLIKPEV